MRTKFDDRQDEVIEGIRSTIDPLAQNGGALGLDGLRLWRDARNLVNSYEIVLVRNARSRGASWTDIGEALGISKQAAAMRFGKFIES